MSDEPIKAPPETPAATPAPSAPRAEGAPSGGAHRSEGHSGGGGGQRREGFSGGGGGGGQRREGGGPGGPGGGGPGGPRRGGKRPDFPQKKVCRFCVERRELAAQQQGGDT